MTHTSTPGPWKTSEALRPAQAPVIWAENGRHVICSMFYMRNDTVEGGYGAYENHEANSNLIAAAPDMLAALERQDRYCRMYIAETIDKDEFISRILSQHPNATIAKARG